MRLILPDVESNSTPTWIDVWRDGRNGYCVQLKTDDNIQIGDSFHGTKEGALMTESEWEQQYNINHKYSMKKRKELKQQLKLSR